MTITPAETAPIPLKEFRRAIEAYPTRANRGQEETSRLTRRGAERWLSRLRNMCDALVQVIEKGPEELATFYVGGLERGARETSLEASRRLRNLPAQPWHWKRRNLKRDRERIEARIAWLLVTHGGRVSTYDPERSDRYRLAAAKSSGAGGRGGGRLAALLRLAYACARVGDAPADLLPTLTPSPERPGRCRGEVNR